MKRPFLSRRPIAAAAISGALLLLSSATASASSAYPGYVKAYFDLDETPACTLCHKTASGGYGTLNAEVGDYLKSDASIEAKLDEDELGKILDDWSETQDSDDDDAFDIDELKAGTDPNDKASKPEEEEEEEESTAGSGGSSSNQSDPEEEEEEEDDENEGLTGVATSAGCSLGGAPSDGAAGGLALAGLAALLFRPRRRPSRSRRR